MGVYTALPEQFLYPMFTNFDVPQSQFEPEHDNLSNSQSQGDHDLNSLVGFRAFLDETLGNLNSRLSSLEHQVSNASCSSYGIMFHFSGVGC